MFPIVKPFRTLVLALAVVVPAMAVAEMSVAADLPAPALYGTQVTEMSRTDYLDRFAELTMLRARFAAVLESDVPGIMRAEATKLGKGAPATEEIASLRQDLTSELYYYTVNLKYLIWAEGAIWPEDKPADTYRDAALKELSAIAGEIASADVLSLDVNAILHRLEQVNAWTEGADAPVEDWFDPAARDRLVTDALEAVPSPTQT